MLSHWVLQVIEKAAWNSFWNTWHANGICRNSISFFADLISWIKNATGPITGNCLYWQHVCFLFKHGVACHITPDPSKRPRRRWSRRIGSLEVMVKSMLDLRQPETFSHKKNGSFHDKERQSVPIEVRVELRLGGRGSCLYAVLWCPSFPAAGQQSQETSVLVVLALLQGYPESRWSRVVLRGEQGRCNSPGQVLHIPAQCSSFYSHSSPLRERTALDVCLCPFCSWFSPLTHCCQTSAVRWRRGRTAGCSGGTRAVTARRAAARTALVLWAMTAGGPAPIVGWMVSSTFHIQKSQYNTIYLFLNFYLKIYTFTIITLIFKNRYKL